MTRSDVAQFAASGRVEEIVEFGLAKPALCYRLDKNEGVDTVRAVFEDNCLNISVPIADAEEWIRSETVGIESAQPTGDNNFLQILVEKDFACLEKRSGEDDLDTFTNPNAESLAVKC